MAATLLTEAMLQISVRMLLTEGSSTNFGSSISVSMSEYYHSLVILRRPFSPIFGQKY
jgi:hypothetical protein